VTGLTCDWISLPKYLDLASQRPVSLMAIQVGKPCLVPGNPASFSPVSPTEGSCPMALGSSCSPPPPPPPQIAPGTLFNSKPTSHVLFPHQQHQQQQHSNNTTKALHVGHVVYASTFSLDRAAHPLIPPHFGRVHADTPQAQSHTHSTEELGRKDRRVPVRQPQVSPSAISHSCLASITKAISLSFRPISPVSNALICHPRPNVKRGGQSAWCCGPPSTQGCISNSTPSTTYISSAQHVFRV
jgi:hypothetical protein